MLRLPEQYVLEEDCPLFAFLAPVKAKPIAL
jgi:hypothetical protein